MTHPLVEEAAKKASIGWFAVDGGPAYGLWCLPHEGDLCIVTGAGEQEFPGVSEESIVTVTLRGDHGGNIVTYHATVTRVRPDMFRWEELAPQLAGKRLNASGTTEQVVERWARECTIWALTPMSEPLPLGSSSGSEAPRPSTATNATRKPFKLHRVRGKRT